jgi:transcriptional regulator with XRE-family HTH domain
VTPADVWAGARLAALRGELTQQQLADLAKIDRSRYNALEKGRQRITPTYAKRLAPHLGVDPDELLPPAAPRTAGPNPLCLLEQLAATVGTLELAIEGLTSRVEGLEGRGRASRRPGHSES